MFQLSKFIYTLAVYTKYKIYVFKHKLDLDVQRKSEWNEGSLVVAGAAVR